MGPQQVVVHDLLILPAESLEHQHWPNVSDLTASGLTIPSEQLVNVCLFATKHFLSRGTAVFSFTVPSLICTESRCLPFYYYVRD